MPMRLPSRECEESSRSDPSSTVKWPTLFHRPDVRFRSVEPDRIGRYRVISRLGAGGMGEVFRGHDDQLDRPVAIKRLLRGETVDPRAVARLLVEARAVAKLEHPNICGIYEVGEDPGGP